MSLEGIVSVDNVADIGTKALNAARLRRLSTMIGMRFPTESVEEISTIRAPTKCVLFELACESASLLSTAWEQRGGTAYRFGLPGNDLRLIRVWRYLKHLVLSHIKQGDSIFVWTSFPCGPWSQWQFVNEHFYEMLNLPEQRQDSLCMLTFFLAFIRWLLHEDPTARAFFEWPDTSAGWKLSIMSAIRKVLQHTAVLNGCPYGLTDRFGERLFKTWRIVTNCEGFVQKGWKLCDRSHPHAQCRGITATESGNYNRRLVSAFITAMLS